MSYAGHRRENQGLLAGLERRTLLWLASRLPLRIHSDHLSALGLAGMLSAAASFAAFGTTSLAAWGVVLSLTLNWFGDSLDGTLARVRGHQRPRYGYYVDHVIDLAGAAMLFAGLACSHLMSPTAALLVLAAYLLVAAETYLATHARALFRMSVAGFGATELRIVIAIGALQAARDPWVSITGIGPVRLFDLGAVIAAAGMVIAFLVSSARNTAALYAAEPRPASDSRSAVA